MPPRRDYAELIALQKHQIRPGSPEIEAVVAAAIEDTLRELLEHRYLYQKLTVKSEGMAGLVEGLMPPDPGPHPSEIQEYERAEAQFRSALRAIPTEITQRPWIAETRHRGDDPQTARGRSRMVHPSGGLYPRIQEQPILFLYPQIELVCGGDCKSKTVFSAHVSSTETGSVEEVYPRTISGGMEQIFRPIYRCERCRRMIYTMLVHRMGPRLHLCGFAPRREPFSTRAVPEHLVPILADAEQAIAEKDVYAAFYHLRTLIEHYIKHRMAIPLSDRRRGEELIDSHYGSLPENTGSVLPSLREAFSTLSGNMHAREGKAEDFAPLRDKICNHFEVLGLLEQRP